MQSAIVKAIELKYSPVAVMWTDEKPEGTLQFKEGRWGCVIAMLKAAAKGKTAVFNRKTFGCLGGGTGLGFGNQYENFPGGIEHFLSDGNKDFCQTEMGKNIVSNMPALEHGERYFKNSEIAEEQIKQLPIRDVPTEYIVFKPLEKVADEEKPKVIVFLANPDQLSALQVLSNYDRKDSINVVAPFGAGCHSVCLWPYQEMEAEKPRAVIGLFDISARKMVDKDILSFTVPFKRFKEMEKNVEGSFLEKEVWLRVLERNK